MAKTKTLKVEFGAPAPNKSSRHIKVSFERGDWEPNDMEALLVNAQLDATFSVDPNSGKDVNGQETMECAAPECGPLTVIVEVKRVTLGDPRCSFSMTMPIDTDPAHLDAFKFQLGKLKLKRLGNASNSGGEGEPEE